MIDTSLTKTFRYRINWLFGLTYFLGGALFTSIGVWMIVSGERAGWIVPARPVRHGSCIALGPAHTRVCRIAAMPSRWMLRAPSSSGGVENSCY